MNMTMIMIMRYVETAHERKRKPRGTSKFMSNAYHISGVHVFMCTVYAYVFNDNTHFHSYIHSTQSTSLLLSSANFYSVPFHSIPCCSVFFLYGFFESSMMTAQQVHHSIQWMLFFWLNSLQNSGSSLLFIALNNAANKKNSKQI